MAAGLRQRRAAQSDHPQTGNGFVLRGDAFTPIQVPGAILTNAAGINPRGDIVGSALMSGGPSAKGHGFLLSQK